MITISPTRQLQLASDLRQHDRRAAAIERRRRSEPDGSSVPTHAARRPRRHAALLARILGHPTAA